VATFAIGEAGAVNAALFAVAMLAPLRPELRARLCAFRDEQRRAVLAAQLPMEPA
jgi:5-(carboxyamino)imidazole ribonucleotide mutase